MCADSVRRRSDAAYEEPYRVLRSNLLVSLGELGEPTVVVTSAYPGEGKTATVVNLAISLAVAGHRVVLVDADLRHPDIHKWFGLSNEHGVADVLLDREKVDACLQYVELDASSWTTGMYVLPAGPSVENPAELLGSPRMASLLTVLAEQADVVLIDTPPVLLVADTLVLGRMTAGALLVVEAGKTSVDAVQQTKDALIRNQSRLLGLVLNKHQPGRQSEATYYGYGDYGDGAKGAPEKPTRVTRAETFESVVSEDAEPSS